LWWGIPLYPSLAELLPLTLIIFKLLNKSTLMLFALCLLLSFVTLDVRAYCECSKEYVVVVDSADCFNAGDYGIENACVNCPVTLPSGLIENRCLSLIREYYGNCAQTGAFNASQQACLRQGGNIASTEFKCQTSAGPNKTQSENCDRSTPTTGGGGSPTEVPTSGGNSIEGQSLSILGLLIPFLSLVLA
jgi:hypothetical protein